MHVIVTVQIHNVLKIFVSRSEIYSETSAVLFFVRISEGFFSGGSIAYLPRVYAFVILSPS